MGRRKGFTLIELLVVVAIIGGLIAILVPSLNKARQQARNAQCKTNLRSMTQAFRIYVDDIGGQPKLPPFFLTLGIIPQKILLCPETATVATAKGSYFGSTFETWAWQTKLTPPEYAYGGYGINYFWARPTRIGTPFYDPGVYNRMKPLNESMIPAFADAAYPELNPDEANCIPITQAYTHACQLAATAMRRHGSATNVAFADTHVEAVKLENLWTLKWKSNWKRLEPYPVPADWKYIPQQP